jgi:hypothetical protein
MKRIHAEVTEKRWVSLRYSMVPATLGSAWCSSNPPSGPVRSNRLMNEFNSFERRNGLLDLPAEPPQPLSHAAHMNPAFIRGECDQPEDPGHAF